MKVIDAHVVPDNVLFLGPTDENTQFDTLAFTDMLKVVASLSKAEEGDKTKCKTLIKLDDIRFNNKFSIICKQKFVLYFIIIYAK